MENWYVLLYLGKIIWVEGWHTLDQIIFVDHVLTPLEILGHCVPSLIPFVVGHAHELFSDNWLYSLKLQNSFHLLLKRHKGQTCCCCSVHTQTLLWKLEDNCVNFYAGWNLYKYLEEVKTRHCLVMIFATSFLKDFSWTLFFLNLEIFAK